MVEFEITPNRPDCLCVIGLAREAAVTFGKKLTIRRLGAIISNPRMPMLGADLEYDEHLSPSQYVESDIRKAQRLSLYRECELEE